MTLLALLLVLQDPPKSREAPKADLEAGYDGVFLGTVTLED